jgi:cellulose synthase/poly-beta-1,6-N-acetylglucosamine synthase-like glycosyltransferase
MLGLLGALLALAAACLAVPAAVVLLECLAALVPGRARAVPPSPRRPRTAVLVPAHDEVAGIAATVRALRAELDPADDLVVVADNCTDRTAELAREAGAQVVERHDPARRGKGFALVFGLERLEARPQGPPEVVVVVDADCRARPGSLARLAELAFVTDRPVQAEYLMAPAGEGAGPVISALAFLVRNRVRPRGLARVGLPVHLTGTGMAFPFHVMRRAPATGSYLVEDLLMGLELALLGHPPLLAPPEVEVRSELPESAQAALKQRTRWEHGQLTTLWQQAPRMLAAGLARGRADLFALGLDLVVPPTALLVLMLVGLTALSALLALLGGPTLALAIAGGGLAAVGAAVLLAWAAFGRETIPFRYLLAVPLYVLWKVPLYAAFFIKGRQKTWERTERKGQPS